MFIFEDKCSFLKLRSRTYSAGEIQRFARQAQKLAKVPGEVDILISGNKRLQELNRRFRRKNKPTDVLSFPRPAGGDIAISADIARQNATLYGHSLAEELKVLILHGMLHLAGHDHESDNGRMARVEARLRTQLKLPASLIDRAHSSVTQKATRNKNRRRQSHQKIRPPRNPPSSINPQERAMTLVAVYIIVTLLCALLVLVSYLDRLYTESGKFLSREFQENIEAFEKLVEPRLLRASRRAALTFAVLTQLFTATIAFLIGYLVFRDTQWTWPEIVQAIIGIILVIIICNRLLPYVLFTRTRGEWLVRFIPAAADNDLRHAAHYRRSRLRTLRGRTG